jgi:hypothetical protein
VFDVIIGIVLLQAVTQLAKYEVVITGRISGMFGHVAITPDIEVAFILIMVIVLLNFLTNTTKDNQFNLALLFPLSSFCCWFLFYYQNCSGTSSSYLFVVHNWSIPGGGFQA